MSSNLNSFRSSELSLEMAELEMRTSSLEGSLSSAQSEAANLAKENEELTAKVKRFFLLFYLYQNECFRFSRPRRIAPSTS